MSKVQQAYLQSAKAIEALQKEIVSHNGKSRLGQINYGLGYIFKAYRELKKRGEVGHTSEEDSDEQK